MVEIIDIANWFLHKENMTHKKVQKLCYYAQAWSYALRDIAISSTTFEAWVHGPVSPELYSQYAGSGFIELSPTSLNHIFSSEELEILESVWETYGSSTANSLEVLTHGEMPWINARNGCPDNVRCQNEIAPNDMKTYYRSNYNGNLEL
ncbi:MAG: Panacea domain-containing protein [Oscillospiraceae bacterium]